MPQPGRPGPGWGRAAGVSTARSNHPGGVNVLHGRVGAFIKDSVGVQPWWAIGTRNGGETVSSDRSSIRWARAGNARRDHHRTGCARGRLPSGDGRRDGTMAPASDARAAGSRGGGFRRRFAGSGFPRPLRCCNLWRLGSGSDDSSGGEPSICVVRGLLARTACRSAVAPPVSSSLGRSRPAGPRASTDEGTESRLKCGRRIHRGGGWTLQPGSSVEAVCNKVLEDHQAARRF